MATHPFMHRQQELIQQLNDLINSYERDLAEVKTKLAREKEAAEEQRKRKLAEILQAIIKVRSVKDSTVAILRRRGMDERKLQEKNSKIFEEYIDSEPEEMAAYQAMAEDASRH